jgi:hypothetical protein
MNRVNGPPSSLRHITVAFGSMVLFQFFELRLPSLVKCFAREIDSKFLLPLLARWIKLAASEQKPFCLQNHIEKERCCPWF